MQSVLEILNKTRAYFESKSVPNANYDAQILLAHALNCKRLDLFLQFEKPLSEDTLIVLRDLVRRRAAREPLQHILGDVEFFGLKLKCDKRALIPRHETEELCAIISADFPDASAELKILDLGTGNGAIALALSSRYTSAKVLGIDKSKDALELANENRTLLSLDSRVEFKLGNWFKNIDDTFDIIVSNPPYLTSAEYDCAQPEVKFFDPLDALVAEDEGLKDLREIISQLDKFLNKNARAYFECGMNQPDILLEEFSASTTLQARSLCDLSKRSRFLLVERV